MYVHRDTQPAFLFFLSPESFPVEKFPSRPQAAANGATKSFHPRLIYFYTSKLYYIYICSLIEKYKNHRWIQFFSIFLEYRKRRKKLRWSWEIFYYLIYILCSSRGGDFFEESVRLMVGYVAWSELWTLDYILQLGLRR